MKEKAIASQEVIERRRTMIMKKEIKQTPCQRQYVRFEINGYPMIEPSTSLPW